MKIASFTRGGTASFGIVTDGGLVDAGARLGGRFADLRQVLAEGASGELTALAAMPADLSFDDVAFQPVISRPDKIICIGLNYRNHVAELGSKLPSHPSMFFRFANAQVGHEQPLIRPRASEQFDYEGELALVVGRACRHVPRTRALEIVAGYTLLNDVTVRDWQNHTQQYGPGKNFYHSGAIGPWLATADTIPDPAALTLVTRLNGHEVQRGSVSDMVFDLPALIEYVTTFTELVPGDIISTGTPAGVGAGRKPPLWMKAGDQIEIEVPEIGVLTNPVVDEEG